MHIESAPQPIMNWHSSPNQPIKPLIIVLILPIRSVIPTITIALRAIPHSGQFDVLFPEMDEEQAVLVVLVPIQFLSASFFFPTIILLLVPIPIFSLLPSLPMPPMSYHNARSGRPSRASSFLDQTLSFSIGSSNLMLRIHRCTFLSCL